MKKKWGERESERRQKVEEERKRKGGSRKREKKVEKKWRERNRIVEQGNTPTLKRK